MPGEPTRLRAQANPTGATLRVLMAHDMETGLRKDSSGKAVPAWHIRQVSVAHNGKPVLTAQFGPAMAKNPFLQLMVKGAKAGDRISVSWLDNRGESRSDDTVVT